MALISCPECGKQISDRATACPDCGCPINATPAVPAPVAAPTESNAEKAAKLLELAHRAKAGGDTKTAKHYYEQIRLLAPDNWEAIFYTVYYEALECKIMNIASAARSVANCLYGTFRAIADLKNDLAITKAIDEVVSASLKAANMFLISASSHHKQFSNTHNAGTEYNNRLTGIEQIYVEIESGLKRVFPDRKKLSAQYQKVLLDFTKGDWQAERLKKEIGRVDPTAEKRFALQKKISSLEYRLQHLCITQTFDPGPGAVMLFLIGSSLLIVFVTTLGSSVLGSLFRNGSYI